MRAPLRFAAARLGRAKPPRLAIDQKFKHLHRIHQRRERALAEGSLIARDDDLVPATISNEGDTTPVRVALLGGPASALEGTAWPLRIEAPRDGSVLGMQSVTLRPLAPMAERRAWLAPLLLQHASDLGLLAARSRVVTLTWNGQDLGLYVATEAPSRHLASASGRTSGAVVGWSANAGRARDVQGGRSEQRVPSGCEPQLLPFDDAFTAPLRVVDSGPDDEVALATLRGFLDGRLDASEAFDARDTAALLALADLWQTHDVLHWTALSLSYDPVSARLSPIAGASAAAGRCRGEAGHAGLLGHALVRHWLASEPIRRHYARARVELAREVATTERQRWRRRISALATALHYASPWVVAPEERAVQRRADALALDASAPLARLAEAPPLPFAARAVIAREQRGRNAGRIELATGGARSLTVLTLGTGEGADFTPLALEEDVAFPLRVEAAAAVGPRPVSTLRYRLPTALATAVIRGRARIDGERSELEFTVRRETRGLAAPTLDAPRVDAVLERHSFLRREEQPDGRVRLRVPPGTWNVDGMLVVPAQAMLVIEPGARLRFDEGRGLLALGPMRAIGTAALPIVLEGRRAIDTAAGGPTAADGWAGVAVVTDAEPVAWHHVEVRGAQGHARRRWRSDAAVLVRAPRFEAEHVTILDSHAEAALRIDRSSAALVGLRIEGARSDAVRVTHSRVAADGLSVTDAGGRGWAQRGGRASLRQAHLTRLGGAALELSELARLEASSPAIEGSALGIVARDASNAAIRGGRIGRVDDAALLAFGAARWGPSSIEAEGVALEGPRAPALAQSGSRIAIDGAAVAPVDVDFAGLQRGG